MHFINIKGLLGRISGLGTGTAALLLCLALSIGGTVSTPAQSGTIVIEGGGLGEILAGGLRWEQQQERNYAPRASRPRSRKKTQSVGSRAHKSHTKRTRTEVARKSTKPSGEERGNKADNAAPAADTEPDRGATSPTAGSSPAAPEPSTTAISTETAPLLTPPQQLSTPENSAAVPSGSLTVPANTASPSSISTPAEITSAQEHLKFLGYDVPEASGTMDLKTKIAIMQFQDAIGAPTTGLLSREQLQRLFQEAAARLQAQQLRH